MDNENILPKILIHWQIIYILIYIIKISCVLGNPLLFTERLLQPVEFFIRECYLEKITDMIDDSFRLLDHY